MKKKLFVTGLCLLLSVWGWAQSLLLQGPPAAKMRFVLRYFRPQLENLSLLSGMYDLSCSVRMGERFSLTVAVPFISYQTTYSNWQGESFTESGRGLGNVAVSLRHISQESAEKNTSFTVGIYLPTLAKNRERDSYFYYSCYNLPEIGYFADYAEFPKSVPFTSLYARAAHYREQVKGWHFGLEGGVTLLLAREDNYTPIFLNYGAAGGRHFGPVDLKAELVGNVQVGGFVDEVYIYLRHNVALGVQWTRGPVRPGIFYSFSLNQDHWDKFRGVLGLGLQIELN